MTDDGSAAAAAHGIPVRLEAVSKRFGSVKAVDGCTLDVPAGSFVTLLGPSGSGKTTVLNLIAGFLNPDQGEVFFSGAAMSGVPPHQRAIGMVFQSFALFPHMSVFDNVAFPLRMRARSEPTALADRVASALEMARLPELAARRPAQLSGGQKQRVAMARALVSRPPLLLLDEPLSALDKNLREELQVEIKALHRKVGSTFICVTHDQQEALAMSDLVAVMRHGRIEQIADPQTLYHSPRTAFVARFLGAANMLTGRTLAAASNGVQRVEIGGGQQVFGRSASGQPLAGRVEVVFRPEAAALEPLAGNFVGGRGTGGGALEEGINRLRVRVLETIFLGEAVKVMLEHGEQRLLVKQPLGSTPGLRAGAELSLRWPVEQTLLMDAEQPQAPP